MDNSKTKRLITWYFTFSVLVVALDLFLVFGPTQQRSVRIWYDYIGGYTGLLFAPAFYGLFSFLMIRRSDRTRAVGRYFIAALAIGIVVIFLNLIGGFLGAVLEQVDNCPDPCRPYLVSTSVLVTTSLAIPVIVVVPGMLAYSSYRASRPSR